MAEMSEVNKFMGEIIRLLTDLVQAVKRNEDLLVETKNLMKNSQNMLESISQSAGMKNIMAASQSLENAIAMLQKGVQTMEIHNALRQVQEFLGAMGSTLPSTGQAKAISSTTSTGNKESPSPVGKSKSSSDDEDSLIKPSDLFG